MVEFGPGGLLDICFITCQINKIWRVTCQQGWQNLIQKEWAFVHNCFSVLLYSSFAPRDLPQERTSHAQRHTIGPPLYSSFCFKPWGGMYIIYCCHPVCQIVAWMECQDEQS
jgi:hypothetical protein